MGHPLAFLLTFTTYGSWLPGAPQGFVDRRHNLFGTPPRQGSPRLHTYVREHLREAPMVFSETMREHCTRSFAASCHHRGWELLEGVVMATHCHVVVSGIDDGMRTVGYLKAKATLRLKMRGLVDELALVWTEGGSVLCLYDEASVMDACAYVASHREVEIE